MVRYTVPRAAYQICHICRRSLPTLVCHTLDGLQVQYCRMLHTFVLVWRVYPYRRFVKCVITHRTFGAPQATSRRLPRVAVIKPTRVPQLTLRRGSNCDNRHGNVSSSRRAATAARGLSA